MKQSTGNQATKERLSRLGENWQLIKDDQAKTVAISDDGQRIFKAFKKSGMVEAVKSIFIGDRSMRFLRGTELLLSAGLDAPKVLRQGRDAGCPFVVMDAVDGPRYIDTVFSCFHLPEWQRARRTLIRLIAVNVGQMHKAGVVHGDLRASNVVIRGEQELHCCFIDNERTRKPLRFERERIRNLVQILKQDAERFTAQDRQQFITDYFSVLDYPKNREEDIIAAVKKRLERRLGAATRPLALIRNTFQVYAASGRASKIFRILSWVPAEAAMRSSVRPSGRASFAGTFSSW
jgi:tRNA A-37 threonylcarbamoyl transferase component Bud32